MENEVIQSTQKKNNKLFFIIFAVVIVVIVGIVVAVVSVNNANVPVYSISKTEFGVNSDGSVDPYTAVVTVMVENNKYEEKVFFCTV